MVTKNGNRECYVRGAKKTTRKNGRGGSQESKGGPLEGDFQEEERGGGGGEEDEKEGSQRELALLRMRGLWLRMFSPAWCQFQQVRQK